jgi:alginate O-acetyltransferase complex protein AlgI
MIFTSEIFLFWFLPAVLLLYYLLPFRFRSGLLVLVSYLFYGWWRPDFVLLMLVSTLIDYWCGRGIGKMHAAIDELGDAAPDDAAAMALATKRKRFLIISMCANLGLLGYFKYWNFGVDSLNVLLETWDVAPIAWAQIVLPVGISFYTFQSMSYSIDVYRKDAPPVDRFIDFACYISLFPQLVAGPIVRYRTLADQLSQRTHTVDKFARGAFLFQLGFIKKLLIADTMAVVAGQAFDLADPTATEAWLGAVAYTFQIYFDFSGYSDMAIGLGYLFGFTLPINFDSPYKSKSITEFWRRWHVSLSTWLRDYLYIPLGGNKKGPRRTYINLGLTMLLGGLWHGAAWTFIVWGAYQGAWLSLERWLGKRSLYSFLPSALQVGCTFVIAIVGWVFFRAETMPQAWDFLGAMFGLSDGGGASLAVAGAGGAVSRIQVDSLQMLMLWLAPAICWFLPNSQELAESKGIGLPRLATAVLFPVAVCHLFFVSYSPFLYFQF